MRAFAAAETYDVTGVVKVRHADGSVVIKHDEIPGFMAAMTMRFDATDPQETAKLEPGDRVRFRLNVSDDAMTAARFEVVGRDAEAAAPRDAGRAGIKRIRPGDMVPAFALLDEAGRPLTEAALKDRLTVITFIFTRCPVPEFCPAMATKFGALQRAIAAEPALAEKMKLLSITLDPEFDRPAVLAEYGKAVGARPEIWNFATGDKAGIETLARIFAVYTERNGVTLDHTLCTALLGPDGRVVEIWRGHGWKPEEILSAARAAGQP